MSNNDGRFKKGQSGNPKGRPPVSEEMKLVKKLSKKQFEEFLTLLVTSDYDEVKRIVEDAVHSKNGHSALKVMMASSVLKMSKQGDWNAVDKLLNRLIGTVQSSMKLTNDPDNPIQMPQVIVTLPSNGREAK